VKPAEILIVEDDDALRRFLSVAVSAEGHHVSAAASGADALRAMSERLFDMALLDIHLPDGNGIDLLRKLKDRDPAVEVILMTGQPEVTTAVQALRLGAYDYLAKPVETDELRTLIGRIIERGSLRQEVRELRGRLGERLAAEELIAVSPAMHRIKETIARVAPTGSTIVIEGETGTGKEVVAAEIHRLSPRRDRAFVPVNCAAVPGDLLESEFFGHARGAFSGAVAEVPGLFRSADQGTLFLDEVTELPPGLQAKLLRVLQDREVRPLGSARVHPVDVRLIAATNRPLEDAVREGRLRRDFFYRLNVVRFTLPPLRERKEDVAALSHHFLRQLNWRFARDVKGISPDAAAALLAYDFPGNVRELEHLLERAYALGARDEIRLADLPTLPSSGNPATAAMSPLEEAERATILRTLEAHAHDKDEAARALGISRRTLYRRLKEFGLLTSSS
jgi:DNA-binding NtrC family response regulator